MTRAECLQILELPATATSADVVTAYKQLVLVWHPDRFPNNEGLKEKAHSKLTRINEAYQLLSAHFPAPESRQPTKQQSTSTSPPKPKPQNPAPSNTSKGPTSQPVTKQQSRTPRTTGLKKFAVAMGVIAALALIRHIIIMAKASHTNTADYRNTNHPVDTTDIDEPVVELPRSTELAKAEPASSRSAPLQSIDGYWRTSSGATVELKTEGDFVRLTVVDSATMEKGGGGLLTREGSRLFGLIAQTYKQGPAGYVAVTRESKFDGRIASEYTILGVEAAKDHYHKIDKHDRVVESELSLHRLR